LMLLGLSKSPIQWSECSVSTMLPGAQSSLLSAGWQSTWMTWRTSSTWVCPPGRSFADKAGGTGAHSDNLNAAAPSLWKFNQGALTISSASEMYSTAVHCLF
jgi:hypothetical protein